ncbi:hypothetical protein OS175_10555 [Marinicella sp. S1101]|uniref:tetratricopeptide repeat protein n=1 Tax=Marinicella marina TaxID=2996016 RepID=UPI002260C4B0|nr:hypothetical protein [Marinicella marina]MCX7554321.1 hypothetical protein [Marinicella marina]MDJ1138688.1 hypothetical protein [Marinicella marina]
MPPQAVENTPPFWRKLGFFLTYLKQEKLYYQITLLAFANVLTFIPIVIIPLLVAALLFLASYKLAFEVLHAVSTGQFTYADARSHEIDDKIGFKAMVMAIIQIFIFLFIYRSDPASGLALLILTTAATPAYLMMLSKTQSVTTSLNPMNLLTVMTRIGFEYWMLLIFFLICGAANLGFRYLMADALPGIIGSVLTAWVLYFLLAYTFAVIGYVMYRHADELGHDTVDTEVLTTQTSHPVDPLKDRIKDLIEQGNAQEAINIINELKADEERTDLDVYLSQAQDILVHNNRLRPADKLQQLIAQNNHKAAIELVLEYLEDGHFIKPKDPNHMSQLITHAFERNQFKTVLKLARDFDQRFPDAHQDVVDNYFLVAKIYYQNKKTDAAVKLLTHLIKKYHGSANVNAPSSYLKGIEKLKG